MNANELRALQAPIKERYKNEPKAAYRTLKAKGNLDRTEYRLQGGNGPRDRSCRPASGNRRLRSSNFARATCCWRLWSSAPVSRMKAVATALDIPLKSASVSAEGDLDFRGTLGVAKDAPVGFAQIRLRFDLDTDAPQDKLDQLLKLTERYCVVYQTIKNGPPVDIKLSRV